MRNLPMLGLMLWGCASAATLYTVTVKTSAAVKGAIITVFPMSAPLGIQATSKPGNIVSFQLPAGKYTFLARPDINGTYTFKDSLKTVDIRGNGTVTLPVEIAAATPATPIKMPATGDGSDLPVQAIQAWKSFVIAIKATQHNCGDAPDTTHLCAYAEMDFSLFKEYVGLHSEFKQTSPWNPLNDGYTGLFDVYGLHAIFAVNQFQGNRVFFAFGQFPQN